MWNYNFYVYITTNPTQTALYIGVTNDLRRRLSEHMLGGVQSTKNRRPLYLLYYEACRSKNLSEKREKYFKTGFGREFLRNRLNDSTSDIENIPR